MMTEGEQAILNAMHDHMAACEGITITEAEGRKVIQIIDAQGWLVALCNDGTIWKQHDTGRWIPLALPPGCVDPTDSP